MAPASQPPRIFRCPLTAAIQVGLLCPVRLGMLLGCIRAMLARMKMVRMRGVRVMRRLLMGAGFVMLRCLGVVVCGVRVMLCSLFVVLRCFL